MADKGTWWRGATLYQVYVRSWRDSNGDGHGDLRGVIDGLGYLQWLGVDCIWLSPTMPSPNTDWGYDVADYKDVHPDFGSLADMDELVRAGREVGVAVMLDLVPNHTSDAHPWFIDARREPGAEHRGYYVWAPPKPDGSPPNNWISATGGSAWELDRLSGQYYLHNFLKTQPDLNWWDQRVHDEFDAIIRFWFDRGIAGFRIDVAHGLYKDAELRDDPAPTDEDHPAIRLSKLKPVYSSHRPEVHGVYEKWRQVADGYTPQRALLGETWEFDPYKFGDFYGRAAPELHMAFNFTFVMGGFRARELAKGVETTLAALPPGATPVWTGSNHDVGRFPTRWCDDDERATRAALVLLSSLPGTMVVYYGDELGMADVDVPLRDQVDEMSLAQPGHPGRDRCRTPMPWSSADNAGFTAPGVRPWLPLGDFSTVNVGSERRDPGSVLNLARHLYQLRRQGLLGATSPLERIYLDEQIWAFRTGEVVGVFNLSPTPAMARLPGALEGRVLASSLGPNETASGPTALGPELGLQPWEAVVFQLRR